MKRITKHLMTLLLSVVMVMAMGLIVFADGTTTYKLTLTGTATGHTYEVYQIFTGDLSTNTDGDKVLSNVEWGTGVTYKETKSSAADVAKALGEKKMTIDQLVDNLKLTKPTQTVESSKGSTKIDGLAAGYYLVKDKNGSQKDTSDAYTKFIVQVVGDTEAKIKSDVPTVEKKVKDTNDSTGKTSDWQDSADADIGDDVQYQITGTMPKNIADYTKYTYKFTDNMSKGLTYTASTDEKKSFKVMLHTSDNDENGTDITSYFNETINDYVGSDQYSGGKVITWTCDNLKGIEGVTLDENTKVVVTYTAKLNENAVIGSTGNPNTVNLTYSNNPNKGGEGETGKTPDDKNIVFTYKTVVNKVDQDGKTSLKGAAFKLEKKLSDGTYSLVKSFRAGC